MSEPIPSEIALREGKDVLKTLLAAAHPIIEADKNHYATERTLRPALAENGASCNGRMKVAVRKVSSPREAYTILGSGVALWKMIGIKQLLQEDFGVPNAKGLDEQEGVHDFGKGDIPSSGLSRLQLNYPNGVTVNWTAVSGISIFAPSRAIYEQMATRFASPQQSQSL